MRNRGDYHQSPLYHCNKLPCHISSLHWWETFAKTGGVEMIPIYSKASRRSYFVRWYRLNWYIIAQPPYTNIGINFPITMGKLRSCTWLTESPYEVVQLILRWDILMNMTLLRILVKVPWNQWDTRRYGSI